MLRLVCTHNPARVVPQFRQQETQGGSRGLSVVSVERFGVMLSRGASCASARCGGGGGLWSELRLFYRGPSGPECRAELEETRVATHSPPSHVARAPILSERGEPKLGSIRIQTGVGAWASSRLVLEGAPTAAPASTASRVQAGPACLPCVFGHFVGFLLRQFLGLDSPPKPKVQSPNLLAAIPPHQSTLHGDRSLYRRQALPDCKCSRIGSTGWVWTPSRPPSAAANAATPIPMQPNGPSPPRLGCRRMSAHASRDETKCPSGWDARVLSEPGSSSCILPRYMHNTYRSGQAQNVECKTYLSKLVFVRAQYILQQGLDGVEAASTIPRGGVPSRRGLSLSLTISTRSNQLLAAFLSPVP